MVNKCVAPNCKTGLDGRNNHAISTFSFPKDPAIRSRWICSIPRDDFTPSKSSVLCEKNKKNI